MKTLFALVAWVPWVPAIGTVLLFVRKRYIDEIRAGTKRFEIRAGIKYAKVRVGDDLSINGRFRVTVTRVEVYATLDALCTAMPAIATDATACYPDVAGPFYVFHFNPPGDAPSVTVARKNDTPAKADAPDDALGQ